MERLQDSVRHLGLHLTEQQVADMQTYYEDLVEWNQRFNLTAITEYEQVQIRHFADSLSCLIAIQSMQRTQPIRPLSGIDVGTGAGFPGIPIKIYCPQMHMTLLEATRKKVDFCQHVIDHLQLANTRAVWGRAEDLGRDPGYREQYDLVFARAVADLSVLAEYTLPFCRIGGLVIAQKGTSAQKETHAAEHAIGLLGGQVQRVIPVELHGLAETRNLVVIDKITRTPERYSRRAGMPAKRPLIK